MCQIEVCLSRSKNEVSALPLAVYVKILVYWSDDNKRVEESSWT
jgi:hypothetical protein